VILPSDAVVYRYIAERHPTLMLDEADAIFNRKQSDYEGLRALLNAGNRRGTRVPRVVGQGAKLKVEEFDTYSPKALVGIGTLPPTVADRAIPIRLERRSLHEVVEKFRRVDVEADAVELQQAFAQFAATATFPYRPVVPAALDDRAAEGWEPMLALADIAGGDWPERARRAAVELHASRDQDEEALSSLLLRDLRGVFTEAKAARLFTSDVLPRLHEIESSPWGDYGGKPMTGHAMAKLLRAYRIEPRELRIGDTTKRGYTVEQFTDAWSRYTASPESSNAASETTKQSNDNGQDSGGSFGVSLPPDVEARADADPMVQALVDATRDGRLDPRWLIAEVLMDGGQQQQRPFGPDEIPR